MNKIRYLDGTRLKNAIIGSLVQLEKNQEYLNRINVFPVPDGDTGTNMYLTMSYVSSGLADLPDRSIAIVSSQLAESVLMGAQGNSGAIMAQFFHGFAQAAKGKLRLTTRAFAAAVENARKMAHSALSDPKEGTILSVMADWADHIHNAAQKTEDFVELLKRSLHTARQSLAETQKKLDVLKKAGVVDAGAQGFVYLLEGIVNFIDRGKIKRIVDLISARESAPTAVPVREVDSEITFRYCTECMLTGSSIDHQQLKESLQHLGDSLIVAGSAQLVRVHLHTNTPGAMFDILARYGEISKKKTDDMQQQHRDAFPSSRTEKIGIVTDSSCDLANDFITHNPIHVIPLKLTFGSQTFLDKVQITPKEFYDRLASSAEHPTTSQPAMADVKQVYDEALPLYDTILSIHLPRVVSGTFQVVENAAQRFGKNKVTCIDGKNVSCALGLVVMEAAAAIKEGLSPERVIERINEAIENVKILVILPTLKYAIRGGRVSRPKGVIAGILHLNPILSFSREGRVILAGKAFGEKNAIKKMIRMGIKQARRYKRIKLIVVHADAYAKAEKLAAELSKLFHVKEDILIMEAAPVLGVHAGPGAVGFAFVGFHD